MSVYAKLQAVKVELAAMNLKKTGKVKGTDRVYYELTDFLPQLNILLKKFELATMISFTAEEAVLRLVDTSDKGGDICIFTSPMSTANMTGCQPVQSMGAVQTYLRRYLYMNAFDIVEADALDADPNIGKPAQKSVETKPETPAYTLDAQFRDIVRIAQDKGLIVGKSWAIFQETLEKLFNEKKISRIAPMDADQKLIWTEKDMIAIRKEITKEEAR